MRNGFNRIARAFLLTVMLLAFLMPMIIARPPGDAVQKRAKRFEPDGEFLPIGDAPKGFENVGSFVLLRLAGNYLNRRSGVYLTNNVTQRFRRATVTRERFSFETVSLRGVSYSFSGKFLQGGVFAQLDLDLDKPLLEGHLIKYKNGEQVAEADMKFSYFGGT